MWNTESLQTWLRLTPKAVILCGMHITLADIKGQMILRQNVEATTEGLSSLEDSKGTV